VKETIDRQPLVLLPSTDGGDVTSQISGNLLPRFQTPPPGIRADLGA